MYAWDALAYLAALRGDEAAFEDRAARCDALGWESGQRAAAAEILYYRGLSYRALGRLDEADEWLTRAIDFAERPRLQQDTLGSRGGPQVPVGTRADPGCRARRCHFGGTPDRTS